MFTLESEYGDECVHTHFSTYVQSETDTYTSTKESDY